LDARTGLPKVLIAARSLPVGASSAIAAGEGFGRLRRAGGGERREGDEGEPFHWAYSGLISTLRNFTHARAVLEARSGPLACVLSLDVDRLLAVQDHRELRALAVIS